VKTTQMREKSPPDHLFPTGNWKSIFTLRGKMERISVLMDRVGGGMNLAVKKSTTERLFGVKIFRATVHSRGEVGIVAGKFRSTLFAQTSSLS
jgi:hypothetical protein